MRRRAADQASLGRAPRRAGYRRGSRGPGSDRRTSASATRRAGDRVRTGMRPTEKCDRAERQQADRAHDNHREPPSASPAGSADPAWLHGLPERPPGMIRHCPPRFVNCPITRKSSHCAGTGHRIALTPGEHRKAACEPPWPTSRDTLVITPSAVAGCGRCAMPHHDSSGGGADSDLAGVA